MRPMEQNAHLVFLRVDNVTFKLLPLRSCSQRENFLLKAVCYELEDYLGRKERFFDRNGQEAFQIRGAYYWKPADKIVRYARRHKEYQFWDWITLPHEGFQYATCDDYIKKFVEEHKSGMTMETAVKEIPQHLKWQRLSPC